MPSMLIKGLDLFGRYLVPLAWASLAANILIVVTGGAVRLTESGLGCPTWPECHEGSLTPHGELTAHAAIEFGNRLLTFAVAAVVIAAFLAAWSTRRRDLFWLAVIVGLGVPAQAVIGGITVLTDLNPWVVAFHLLCSMAMIGVATLFLWRIYHPSTDVVRGPGVWLAWATFVTAWAVLYVGTIVTGSGPHAGDIDAKRNGLDPELMSQFHADLVFLLVGLSVGLLVYHLATKAPARTTKAVGALLAVELAQGIVGYVQYFTNLPVVLVGLHMFGAALISATVTWALLATRAGSRQDPAEG